MARAVFTPRPSPIRKRLQTQIVRQSSHMISTEFDVEFVRDRDLPTKSFAEGIPLAAADIQSDPTVEHVVTDGKACAESFKFCASVGQNLWRTLHLMEEREARAFLLRWFTPA